MVLVDASGWIAMIRGEPGAEIVKRLVADNPAAITTANLVEVYDVCERVHGVPSDAIDAVLGPLLDDALDTIPLDVDLARRAADIRVAHYHARDRDVSLADCALVASAGRKDSIATADRAVLDVAAELGIETIDLA